MSKGEGYEKLEFAFKKNVCEPKNETKGTMAYQVEKFNCLNKKMNKIGVTFRELSEQFTQMVEALATIKDNFEDITADLWSSLYQLSYRLISIFALVSGRKGFAFYSLAWPFIR